jgi:murein DD-endopeptidase MepM/ murein hydrolase activator NlpD
MEIKLGRPLPKNIGRVSQWFGMNPAKYKKLSMYAHNGVDYSCRTGTPVLAMHNGIIEERTFDPGGYGIHVKVIGEHYDTLYAHLTSVIKTNGAKVSIGEIIALSGNTGNSTGPHLHMGLRVHGMLNPGYYDYVDPVPFRED